MQSEQFFDLKPFDSNVNVGLAVSDYYKDIAQNLLLGVESVLNNHPQVRFEIARVAGAWEIPLVSRVMAQTGRYQALIALGCVIRGETSHFDFLCRECSAALMSVSMDFTIPVGFGVLTVESYAQAQQRSDIDDMKKNKGREAAIGTLRSLYAVAEIRQG